MKKCFRSEKHPEKKEFPIYCNPLLQKRKYLNDLKTLTKELKDLERKITLFHAKVIKELDKISEIDLIGFHGQTIFFSVCYKKGVSKT